MCVQVVVVLSHSHYLALSFISLVSHIDLVSRPIFFLLIFTSLFSFVDYILNTIQTCKRYFDFFEEAFNYIACKGYIRMRGDDEQEWLDTMNHVHAGVKGGMKYNTGKLLLVLYKPLAVTEEGEFP